MIKGDNRRKNVTESLVAINEQILPVLKTKKYVIIKPNALGTTHVDALRGILDYLAPRFKGPVVIAESSTGDTTQWMEKAGFPELLKEYNNHSKLKVSLVDLNEEAKYVVQSLLDYDLHVVPARLAARLFDPDAYIIGSACFKVHNIAVVTLSIKNMVLGAPLHQTRAEAKAGITWLDKRRYHAGIRQSLYNIYVTAARMRPFWGATVIDGYEGRENGGVVAIQGRDRFDRLRGGRPGGLGSHGRQPRMARLAQVLRRIGRRAVGPGEDRHPWQQAGRGPEGVPPASRHRAAVEVDGTDGGTAADARVGDAPQAKGRRRLCKRHRLSGRSGSGTMRAP